MNREHGIKTQKQLLQMTIVIEHTKWPPYLFECQLMHSKNPMTAMAFDRILTGVTEEMLNMACSCNIVNAIVGKPIATNRYYIPKYQTAFQGYSQIKH